MKPWCANCRIELPSEGATNAGTERLTEFISYHEGYEVKVTVTEAILTVFECGMKLNHVKIPTSRSTEMCSQCTAVLAELYRFYVEFMKLSREASYMQELLRSSMLWDFGVEGLLEERDSKQDIIPRAEEVDMDFAAEIVPKIQIHVEEDAGADPAAVEGAGAPKFPCPSCGKVFTRKADMQRHVRTVHEKSSPRKQPAKEQPAEECAASDEELDDEDRFLRQAQKYASEEPGDSSEVYKCAQCDKTFRRKDYLQAHEARHLPPEERKRELQQRRAIERLHSRSKARKPRTKLRGTAGKKRGRATYRCTECDSCFPTRETMKYHRRKVHPKNSYPCPACDRIFHSENDLKIHENVKHGVGEKLADRICPVEGCGKYFALPNIMKRHVQSVHCEEKDRIYACPHCPLKFPIKNRLDTHLKNRHNSDNSLQTLRCEHEDCGRVYETKSGLQQHIETVHTNQRVYSCDICGRTSIRPEWLRKHLELHDSNREKKFACPEPGCQMRFFRMASLKKHMKNHSGRKITFARSVGINFGKRVV